MVVPCMLLSWLGVGLYEVVQKFVRVCKARPANRHHDTITWTKQARKPPVIGPPKESQVALLDMLVKPSHLLVRGSSFLCSGT